MSHTDSLSWIFVICNQALTHSTFLSHSFITFHICYEITSPFDPQTFTIGGQDMDNIVWELLNSLPLWEVSGASITVIHFVILSLSQNILVLSGAHPFPEAQLLLSLCLDGCCCLATVYPLRNTI